MLDWNVLWDFPNDRLVCGARGIGPFLFGHQLGLFNQLIAIWMVFNPIELALYPLPTDFPFNQRSCFPWIVPVLKLGTYNVQGAFMKRQEEVSDVFVSVVTEDLITLEIHHD